MNFQLVIIEDNRGDEYEIAVAGTASFEEAYPKAFRHAYDVLGLNVEGMREAGVVTEITPGMTAI